MNTSNMKQYKLQIETGYFKGPYQRIDHVFQTVVTARNPNDAIAMAESQHGGADNAHVIFMGEYH